MIEAKRRAFHLELRNNNIKTMMSEIRVQLSRKERNQNIIDLIAVTENNISKINLRMLLQWCALGQTNAIIHLGNLMIGDKIQASALRSMEEYQKILEVKNKYLGWLLCLLYQRQNFGQKELICLARVFVQWKEAQVDGKISTYEEIEEEQQEKILSDSIVPILKSIFQNHSSALEFILFESEQSLNKKFVRKIIQIANQGSLKLSSICFSLISLIISKDSKIVVQFASLSSIESILELILNGILRRETKIRALSVQIVSNLLITLNSGKQQEEYLEGQFKKILCERFLKSWQAEKLIVQVEISYFIIEFVKFCSLKTLKSIILEHGFIREIMEMLQSNQNAEISKNCWKILCLLHQIRENFEDSEIYIKIQAAKRRAEHFNDMH